jgi:hypothetical protein
VWSFQSQRGSEMESAYINGLKKESKNEIKILRGKIAEIEKFIKTLDSSEVPRKKRKYVRKNKVAKFVSKKKVVKSKKRKTIYKPEMEIISSTPFVY